MARMVAKNRLRIYAECECGRTLEVSTNPVTRIKMFKHNGWKETILSETKCIWHCPQCQKNNQIGDEK